MSKKIKKFIIECIATIIGALIIAISVSFFLLPNELSSGGFTGIATILYYTLKIPMGTTILCLNIPLFLFSGYKIGKKFFAKTMVGTISLSIFIDLLEKLPALTQDKVLASVYGGILMGIGTAIILKADSSTGGSDLVTFIIKKYIPKIEMGKILVIIDFTIVFLNVIFLGNIEIGLYSTIAIYLMGFMIDIIFEGIYFSKLLIIISDKSDIIANSIKKEINRGVTGLYGKGMYTGDDKTILLCAVARKDLANIKNLIINIDKNAFMIITNSREVLGYGFKIKKL